MQSLPSQLARSALDAAPDAMIIIDDAGAIRFANRQVSALFAYSHDELIGKPVECLIPERLRNRHFSMREAYAKNARVRPMGAGLNLFGRRRDGSEFPVEISLSPIDDEGRILVAAAIRDVTERKRTGQRGRTTGHAPGIDRFLSIWSEAPPAARAQPARIRCARHPGVCWLPASERSGGSPPTPQCQRPG